MKKEPVHISRIINQILIIHHLKANQMKSQKNEAEEKCTQFVDTNTMKVWRNDGEEENVPGIGKVRFGPKRKSIQQIRAERGEVNKSEEPQKEVYRGSSVQFVLSNATTYKKALTGGIWGNFR